MIVSGTSKPGVKTGEDRVTKEAGAGVDIGAPPPPNTSTKGSQLHQGKYRPGWEGHAGVAAPTDLSSRDTVKGKGGTPGDRMTAVGGKAFANQAAPVQGAGIKTTSDFAGNRMNQLNRSGRTIDKTNKKVGQASESEPYRGGRTVRNRRR